MSSPKEIWTPKVPLTSFTLHLPVRGVENLRSTLRVGLRKGPLVNPHGPFDLMDTTWPVISVIDYVPKTVDETRGQSPPRCNFSDRSEKIHGVYRVRYPYGFRDRPKRTGPFFDFLVLIMDHGWIQKGSGLLLPSLRYINTQIQIQNHEWHSKKMCSFVIVPLYNQYHVTKSGPRVVFKKGPTFRCHLVTNSQLWFIIFRFWWFLTVVFDLHRQSSLRVLSCILNAFESFIL